jgi:anti-sigma regulatory factor (Ser/Thr protein kinase)
VTTGTTQISLALTAPAVPSSVRRLRAAAAETVAELASNDRVVDDVSLCVSEAVSNVVRHAYRGKRGEIELSVERLDDEVEVVVRDSGVGLTGANRRRAVGGYGLKIIEKVARRFSVSSRKDGGTEVRMAFHLGG